MKSPKDLRDLVRHVLSQLARLLKVLADGVLAIGTLEGLLRYSTEARVVPVTGAGEGDWVSVCTEDTAPLANSSTEKSSLTISTVSKVPGLLKPKTKDGTLVLELV